MRQGRTVLAGLALAASIAVLNAGSAQAFTLPDLQLQPPAGVLPGVSEATCPATTALAPVLPPLTDTLATLTCSTGSLEHRFHTVWRRPDGTEVTRTSTAFVNVPSLLNVDDDIAPDIVARVELLDLTLQRFGLRIERMLGEIAPLPVSVEALIDDPTGALPRAHIAAGYDARESQAPVLWEAIADIGESTDAQTAVDITVDTDGAGASLATTGGLYDGSPTERTDPMGARLNYAPVPASAGVGLRLMGDRYEVGLTTSEPSRLTAEAELISGPEATRADGVIDELPSATTVTYQDLGNDQRTIAYEASAPVGAIDLDVDRRVGDDVALRAIAHLRDLPTGILVEQTGPTAGEVSTDGGPIGVAEAGFGNADPRFLDLQDPYVRSWSDGADSTFAVRVERLLGATFAAGDDQFEVDALFAPGPGLPFSALFEEPGRTVEGSLEDLPEHVSAAVDVAAGTVHYDGHGATIARVRADGVSDTPFAGRIRRISAEVDDLPPLVDVAFAPDGSQATFTSSEPVGRLQARLDDGGATESLPAGEAGVRIVDSTTHFEVLGRVFGLRSASFSRAGSEQLTLSTKLAPGPFSIGYRSDDMDVDGRLEDLPARVDLDVDLNGSIGYSGHGDTIDRIDVEARHLTGTFFGRVDVIEARIEGLAPVVAVGFLPHTAEQIMALGLPPKPLTEEMSLAASAPIKLAQVHLSSDGVAPLIHLHRNMARLIDKAARFSAFARVHGLERASFRRTGKDVRAQLIAESRPFGGRYESDALESVLTAHDLPGEVTIEVKPDDGLYSYEGATTIDTLDATVHSATDLTAGVRHLRAHVEELPPGVDISAAPDGGSFRVTASEPVGLVEVEAYGDPAERVDVPGGIAGVAFADETSTGGNLATLARLSGLKEITVETDPLDVELEAASPQPVAVLVDKTVSAGSDLHLDGSVEDLPARVRVRQQGDDVLYSASHPIERVEVHATGLPGDADGLHEIDAVLQDVGTGVSLVPIAGFTTFLITNGGVGLIDLQARTDGDPIDLSAVTGNVIRVTDADTSGTRIGVRVANLESAKFGVSVGAKFTVENPLPLDVDVRLPAEDQPVPDLPPSLEDMIAMDLIESAATADMVIKTRIEQPPQDTDILVAGGTIKYTADRAIPEVPLSIRLPGLIFDGVIKDVPAKFTLCTGRLVCTAIGAQFSHLLQDVALTLDTHATATTSVKLDGRLCTLTYEAFTVTNCRQHPRSLVQFKGVRVGDFKFETGDGFDGTAPDDEGLYGAAADQDDLVLLAMDTDDRGILVNELTIAPAQPYHGDLSGVTDEDGFQAAHDAWFALVLADVIDEGYGGNDDYTILRKDSNAFKASDFFVVVDTSLGANPFEFDTEAIGGSLECFDPLDLYVPGVPFDIAQFFQDGIGCD